MKLLLSNDDGVFAPGIAALAMELKKYFEIVIAAPERERSGASHCMTYDVPLRAKQVVLPGLEDVPAYAINGTPADCVRLGCGNLFSDTQMVVSGINRGANLGSDVFYSGTVGAAMEGAFVGRPAIAVSNIQWVQSHLDVSAKVAKWAVDYLMAHPMKPYSVLNINVPDLPEAELRGARLTGLALRRYAEVYEERKDTVGRPYYWMPAGQLQTGGPDEDCDECWAKQGYVTLTPIHYDIADYSFMKQMRVDDFKL